MVRTAMLTGTAIWCALLAGCGSGDPFPHVQISGKVTYDDGSLIPAERVAVTFLPQVEAIDAKTHARPGRAELNTADGTFDTVATYKYGDGVVKGQHKVLVQSFDALGTPTGEVPAEYADAARTPLTIDTANAPLTITVKKPQ